MEGLQFGIDELAGLWQARILDTGVRHHVGEELLMPDLGVPDVGEDPRTVLCLEGETEIMGDLRLLNRPAQEICGFMIHDRGGGS